MQTMMNLLNIIAQKHIAELSKFSIFLSMKQNYVPSIELIEIFKLCNFQLSMTVIEFFFPLYDIEKVLEQIRKERANNKF